MTTYIKSDLWAALRNRRAMMLGQLDGLTEFDKRRPLTPRAYA